MNLRLELSPFVFDISSSVGFVHQNLQTLYPDYLLKNQLKPVDYFVSVEKANGLRKFIRPQASFRFDALEPFKALPLNHAYASLEWGMNYVVANQSLEYVILHSGIVAKGNNAVLLPGPPGSGKSTMTAYLSGRDEWRLLSDEMALVLPGTINVQPFVRPICLKNKSVDLVKRWYPDAKFSTVAKNTHKGDVVHFCPSDHSWEHRDELATVKAIVFPRYDEKVDLEITQLNQNQGFMQLAQNAVNLNLHGEMGFNTMVNLVENSAIFEVVYNNVESVKTFLEQDVL
ncbi:MAG: HprK-related kinase A [Alteromonadaceae bacterium]|nr:HprK-related kinase A [Alteromonadaceae bacterium]